jgi:hypothetical protein
MSFIFPYTVPPTHLFISHRICSFTCDILSYRICVITVLLWFCTLNYLITVLQCVKLNMFLLPTESCFRLSLTNRKPPLFCRQGYLRKHGIVRNSQLWQHAHEAVLMPGGQDSASTDTDPAFPDYLTRAGASVSSAINLDF